MICILGSLNGSVLDWYSASWDITPLVQITDTPLTELCAVFPNKTYVVFPELREIDSAATICATFGKSLN